MDASVRPERFWKTTAGLNGFIAVLMAAVGAHAVANPYATSLMEKASNFQLIHAVVLLYLAPSNSKLARAAMLCFLTGTVLFCGSLYIKALAEIRDATLLAPAGGVSFMLGWLLIAFDGIRKRLPPVGR